MAASALRAMDWYAKTLHIFGEGNRRIMESDHWNGGIGIGLFGMANGENGAGSFGAGYSKGNLTTEYTEPAWLRASASRTYSKEDLIAYWQNNQQIICDLLTTGLSDRTSWDSLAGINNSQKADIILLEDYIISELFESGSCDLPYDLHKYLADKAAAAEAAEIEQKKTEEKKTAPADKEVPPKQQASIDAKEIGLQANNVEFDYDKAVVRADQVKNAQSIAQFLFNNLALLPKGFRFFIYSTCSIEGSKEWNYKLGMARAHAIADPIIAKLIEMGMSPADAKLAVIPATSGKDTLLFGVPEKDRKVFLVVGKIVSNERKE